MQRYFMALKLTVLFYFRQNKCFPHSIQLSLFKYNSDERDGSDEWTTSTDEGAVTSDEYSQNTIQWYSSQLTSSAEGQFRNVDVLTKNEREMHTVSQLTV